MSICSRSKDNRMEAQDHAAICDRELKNLGYSLRRFYVDSFHFCHVPTLPVGESVLDLAGNRIDKRGCFDIERYGLPVVYANLSLAKRPDVQADGTALPFRSGKFGAVICSELLEHVPYPPDVLSEAHRVLRPGGTLLVCVPFLNRIHGDPFDFGRYTDYYWARTLEQAGFTGIRIEKQGQFWSVVVDMLRDLAVHRTKGPVLGRPGMIRLIARVIGAMKRTALKWDRRAVRQADAFAASFTTGFGIIARKDGGGGLGISFATDDARPSDHFAHGTLNPPPDGPTCVKATCCPATSGSRMP
jgi:SAM-dependent methyltransferase